MQNKGVLNKVRPYFAHTRGGRGLARCGQSDMPLSGSSRKAALLITEWKCGPKIGPQNCMGEEVKLIWHCNSAEVTDSNLWTCAGASCLERLVE